MFSVSAVWVLQVCWWVLLDSTYILSYASNAGYLIMSILNIAVAWAKLNRLIEEAIKTHWPIIITSKHGNAVLISESDWNAISETLYLLSVPGMHESIKQGLEEDVSVCDKEINCWPGNWFIRSRHKNTQKLSVSSFDDKARKLLAIIQEDLFQNPPRVEKLVGNLSGVYSRRVNIQKRIVCQVYE